MTPTGTTSAVAIETAASRTHAWGERRMFVFKQPGRRAQVRFMPGCLIWSLVLSIGLTILVNVLIRLF